MTRPRLTAALLCAAVLGACAAPDLASRGVPALGSDLAAVPLRAGGSGEDQLAPRWAVKAVRVTVPDTLSVSEANLFYPVADIVWRGDPRGDRRAQVEAIMQEAFAAATQGMARGPAAIVEVQVARFHGVTEKTRYTVGGVHAVQFDLTVRDAATGAVLDGPRRIVADIPASGGRRAIEEESRGLTQRVVVVRNLAHVALRELSAAPGPAAPLAAPLPVSRREDDLRLAVTAVSMKNETIARTAPIRD
ncbi:MAG: DUF6778 family protein [Gemmobacter sp.]